MIERKPVIIRAYEAGPQGPQGIQGPNADSSSFALIANVSGAFDNTSSSFGSRIAVVENFSTGSFIRPSDTSSMLQPYLLTSQTASITIDTSSFAIKTNITGAFTSTSSSFGSRITTVENTQADLLAYTSSLALKTNISGAFTSLSQSITSGYLPLTGGIINGNVQVLGTGSIAYFTTLYNTSSILYQSGSTKFGDTMDDKHEYTGSLYVTGSTQITGSVTISGSLTASGSVLVGRFSYIGVGDSIHGALADRTLNLDDGTYIGTTGLGGSNSILLQSGNYGTKITNISTAGSGSSVLEVWNPTTGFGDILKLRNNSGSYIFIAKNNGNIGIAGSPVSKFTIPVAPDATSSYGLISLGDGPFDGFSTGKFVGSVSGTILAINTTGSYGGDVFKYAFGGSTRIQIAAAGTYNMSAGAYILGNNTGVAYHTGAVTALTLELHASSVDNILAKLKSPNDGIITLYNNGLNGFDRLQLGGTAASSSAIQNYSGSVRIRAADDSNYAALYAGNIVSTGSMSARIVQASSASGFRSSDGSSGTSGTFTTTDGKTITIKDGIVTSIV